MNAPTVKRVVALLALASPAYAQTPTPAAALADEALQQASAIAAAVARNEDDVFAADLARHAVESAEEAVALDPALPQAYLALGIVHRQFWRWPEAEAAFAAAYDLTPDDPNVAFNYAWFSAFSGESARAIAIAELAASEAPERASAYRDLGIVNAYAGRLDAAADALGRCTELDPTVSVCHIYLAFMHERRGDDPGALEELRTTEQLFGGNMTPAGASSLAHAYSRAGAPADAERVVARLEEMARTRVVGAGTWPLAYLATGDVEGAYRWLERAVEKIESNEPDEGFFNLMIIKANVQANPMLDEPRFAALRGRIGSN